MNTCIGHEDIKRRRCSCGKTNDFSVRLKVPARCNVQRSSDRNARLVKAEKRSIAGKNQARGHYLSRLTKTTTVAVDASRIRLAHFTGQHVNRQVGCGSAITS